MEECCCHEEVNLVCNHVWVNDTRQRCVHINARTQEFSAGHLIVTRLSMLTSPVSGSMFWLMVYIHVLCLFVEVLGLFLFVSSLPVEVSVPTSVLFNLKSLMICLNRVLIEFSG